MPSSRVSPTSSPSGSTATAATASASTATAALALSREAAKVRPLQPRINQDSSNRRSEKASLSAGCAANVKANAEMSQQDDGQRGTPVSELPATGSSSSSGIRRELPDQDVEKTLGETPHAGAGAYDTEKENAHGSTASLPGTATHPGQLLAASTQTQGRQTSNTSGAATADKTVETAACWSVDVGGDATQQGPGLSLQERFARFRKERQRERRLAKFVNKKGHDAVRDEAFKEALRLKFVKTAQKYLGVPYAAKYHGPESPHYNAPLYLDCCGLVRRALQDLQEDFGFRIGRWNQNYQYDVLPKKISFAELKPGDLVFVEGHYSNPDKMRKQKYDLVHVEIFIGGETGEATIGARHQRGVVCVHPSYKYTSKSYTIDKYHFCSIDDWLEGRCAAAHPEHWQSRDANIAGGSLLVDASGHRSVFDSYAQADGDAQAESQTHGDLPTEMNEQMDDGEKVFYVEKGNGWKLVAKALEQLGWRRLPFEYGFRQSFTLKWVQTRAQIDYVAHKPGQLVNHIPNNTVITSKLGLLETLREYYETEGQPETACAGATVVPGSAAKLDMPSWFPETYRLDHPHECLRLLSRHAELSSTPTPGGQAGRDQMQRECDKQRTEQLGRHEPVWILKPASANCGRGIRLVTDSQGLRHECFGDPAGDQAPTMETPDGKSAPPASTPGRRLPSLQAAVAQRYVLNPLLLSGRKFDLRMYCLIASTEPAWRVYFHPGYARLSLEEYSCEASGEDGTKAASETGEAGLGNRFMHLTNASVQKKHPAYKEKFADSLWGLDRMEAELVGQGLVEKGWAGKVLCAQVKRVMLEVFRAAKGKLARKSGYFDLLGFDFLLDDTLGLHLLEVNTNPALHLDNDVLAGLIPGMVQGALHLVLDAHGMSSCEQNGTARAGSTDADGKTAHRAESHKLERKDVPLPGSDFELLFDET